jgi:O-antigen ligase
VIIAAGFASALFGLFRQSLQSADSASGFVLPLLFYGLGYSQFISSNAFGFLMEMTLGLLLGLIVGGAVPWRSVPFYAAIALVLWASLVLSNSRGSVLGLICQTAFLAFVAVSWYRARRSSPEHEEAEHRTFFKPVALLLRAVLILTIIGTLIVGVVWLGGQSLAQKFEANSPGSEAGVTRKDIWRSSWDLFKEHPFTGVGFGAYFLAITKHQIGSGRTRVEEVHNDYLDLAANGGIVAIGLAIWFAVLMVRRARLRLRSRDAYRRAAALGAVAGILSVGVHSLVDFGLQITGLAAVFCGLIVIAVADVELEPGRGPTKGVQIEDVNRFNRQTNPE